MKDFFIKRNRFTFFLIGIFALFSTSLIFNFCTMFVENKQGPSLMDGTTGLFKQFIYAGIVAPLLETLIFQHFIYIVLRKFIHKEKILIFTYIISSSILFSLEHKYSTYYIFVTFFLGIVLGFSYYISKLRKESAYWNTAIIHGLYNSLLVLISSLLLK